MNKRLGRYEILRKISSGGMATVHLGRVVGEGGFQRLLAIKLMHAHLAEDPEFVAMFLDEARLAASIRHPNVVGTMDVQRGAEGMFIVMDFIDGPSLARMIRHLRRQNRYLDLGVALRIILDMLAGLHAAHELRGVDGELVQLIHRDISPSNVLIGSDGVARITDFGIARAEARISSTRGKQLKGKLPYMAPEQLSSRGIDRRVDVYAGGCVLWEALTGRRLFEGDDEAQLLAKVLGGPEYSPRQLRPDVPESIDQVCMQALAATDDRYFTAADFADAIEEAALNERVRVAPARDVGAFVAEMFPAFQQAAQSSGADLSMPDLSSLGSRAIDTPASGNNALALNPALAPAAIDSAVSQVSAQVSAVRAVSPGAHPQSTGPFDTNPHTHASAVAYPTDAPVRRSSKAALTAIVAFGAAAVGGVVVWLAAGPSPTAAAGGAATATSAVVAPEPSETMVELPGESQPVSGAASGEPTATSSASASAKVAAKAPWRPRTPPRPKSTAQPKSTAKTSPTTQTTSKEPKEFRPDKP